MNVIQTEDNSFVRDLHSKALINTDRVALENYRRKKQLETQQAQRLHEMEIKVKELVNVKDDMLEIKSLLQKLVNTKEL